MAQTIKLKRSATQGAIPATSALSLGEVAINTYDGKMYIKKSVGGTESVVEVGGSGGGLASSFTVYEYSATANQTTFSGSDGNSNTLAYDTDTPPKILVYLNGVLLDFTTDYTASNGTSVVLTNGAAANDLVQIAAYKSSVSTSLDIDLSDNQKVRFGDSQDLQIWHGGVDSYVTNDFGHLQFIQKADDKDIQFYADDGTGGHTQYMSIDGDEGRIVFNKWTRHVDGARILVGTGGDLAIYHDGSNSYIADQGTGVLNISGSSQVNINAANGENAIQVIENGGVRLRHNNLVKLDTTSTGIDVTGAISAASVGVTNIVTNKVVKFNGSILDDSNITDTGSAITLGSNTTVSGTISSGAISSTGNIAGSNLNIVSTNWLGWGDYGERIAGSNTTSSLYFSTDATTALTLDGSQNATFAGTISSGAITSSGNVSLTGALYVDSTTAIDKNGNYMVYHDGSGGAALYAGNTSDNRNYYQSDNHRFRSNDAGTNFAEIGSLGMIIGDNGPEANMGKLHVKDSDSGATPYQSGNGGITIERNGRAALNFLTPSNQDAYVFFGDPQSANAGYVGYEHANDILVLKSAGYVKTSGSGLNISAGYLQMGGTGVIDGNRNITAGTISSGAITSSGDFSTTGSITSTDGSGTFAISGDTSSNTYLVATGEIRIRPSGTSVNKLVIGSNGNLTTVGTITSGNITTSGYLAGPATFTIDPAAVGDNTGTVVIAGNLQVDGTTTTINSTTLTVDDKNITLASGSTNKAAANGAGLTVDCGSDTDATFSYDGTNDEWDFNKNVNVTGAVVSSANGAITTASGTTARFQVNETGGAITAMDARGSTGNIGTRSNHTLGFLVNDVQKATLSAGGDFTVTNDIKVTTTNPRIDYDGGNSGALRFFSTSAAQERMRITSGGNVGIGTTNPGRQLTVEGTSDAYIKTDATSHTSWTIGSDTYGFLIYDDDVGGIDGYRIVVRQSSGNVGVGTTQPQAKFQVEEAGIETTTTSTTATTQVAIDSFQASAFRSARYTIQVTNSTDSTYHLTEILLIHDGTTPQITEYGTIFTGSAEATFDADISSGNVRLLATPATTDSMTFKVVRHCITV